MWVILYCVGYIILCGSYYVMLAILYYVGYITLFWLNYIMWVILYYLGYIILSDYVGYISDYPVMSCANMEL